MGNNLYLDYSSFREGIFNLRSMNGLYQNIQSSRNCELHVFVSVHFSKRVHSSYEILKGVPDTSPKVKNCLLRG